MPTPKTALSTPRLSEYARRFVYPPGIERTVWTRVEAKGLTLGLGFDWWQTQLGTVCLGYGADGKYVATVGGIGMSIPRQVGKTYFVLAMLVILCVLFPGLQVVWTAHHLRTSTKTFTALRGICRRKKVAPHIRTMRSANGEQQVEFTNGSIIMFGARSQGFGRGFDEIDVEVFDEAQILDVKALEDMIAATNQARHPHGALLFYMGTPPRPTDPSEAFANRRKDAWSDTPPEDAIWLEIGADPGSHPDDRSQWPLMNPSFPLRTPEESLLRLKKNLKDEDSWNREGRGIWDGAGGTVVPIDAWMREENPRAGIDGPVTFAVAVAEDRSWACVAASGEGPAGLHVEVTGNDTASDYRPGTGWVAARVKELVSRHVSASVILRRNSQSASLTTDLEDEGVRVVTATTQDYAEACGMFYDAVDRGELTHLGQGEVTVSIRGAVKRNSGDAYIWDQRKSTIDISPLEAVTLAHWGHKVHGPVDVTEAVW